MERYEGTRFVRHRAAVRRRRPGRAVVKLTALAAALGVLAALYGLALIAVVRVGLP